MRGLESWDVVGVMDDDRFVPRVLRSAACRSYQLRLRRRRYVKLADVILLYGTDTWRVA